MKMHRAWALAGWSMLLLMIALAVHYQNRQVIDSINRSDQQISSDHDLMLKVFDTLNDAVSRLE